MPVARIRAISTTSRIGFDNAVARGIERANKTLKNISGAWVNEMRIDVQDGQIDAHRLNMRVTFVLDD